MEIKAEDLIDAIKRMKKKSGKQSFDSLRSSLGRYKGYPKFEDQTPGVIPAFCALHPP
jgi:hypothetical protein